jgi:formate-dependent nitrite reductase cytochrome c552 subunit
MADPQTRDKEKMYQQDKYQRRSAMLGHIKLMLGCADCGYNKYSEALDFDHLPGSIKVKAVSLLIMGSLKRVFEEIDKCEVVCANCHRHRTTVRDQWKFPWKTQADDGSLDTVREGL